MEYTDLKRLKFSDLGGHVTFVTAFGEVGALLLRSKF
jgi:hypothetical protein